MGAGTCGAEDDSQIRKRIRLEGYITGRDGDGGILYDVLIDLFEEIFRDLGEYPPSYYDPRYLPVKAQLDRINFLIGFEPNVAASVDFLSDTVKINLFNLSFFSSLSIFGNLIDMLKNTDEMNIDDMLQLFRDKQYKKEGLAEYREMMNKLGQYSIVINDENTLQLKWDLSAISNTEQTDVVLTAVKIIFHHEMAHWHYSRFNDQTQTYYDYLARNTMLEYLQSEESFYEEDVSSCLTPEVIGYWAEEIVADTMSLSSLLNRCSSPAERRTVYMAAGLYYSLLETQEDYSGLGTIRIHKTHPPVRLREEIVLRLLADAYDLSLYEYVSHESGAWFVYSRCVYITLDHYRKEIYGKS